MVEVCDICGDIGVVDALFKCWKCKINQQHVYCRKNLPRIPQDIYDEWYCDECERETTGSPKYVKRDLHKTFASNLSVHNVGTSSAQNGKYWRGEKLVTKGKVKCIPSEEVIKLSSGSKRGESPIKTTKQFNLCPKTPIHQKSFPSKSPFTQSSSPVNKHTYSATQRQGSQISNVFKVAGAKNATAVKEPSIPSAALCGWSPKKQFVSPISPPEAEVDNPGKEIYKEDEASNALSLKKQSPQPISSGVKYSTPVKETSMPREDLCGQLPEKQFSSLSSSDKSSVETEFASLGKETYKASEASNTLSLMRQFSQPQLISAAPAGDKDATAVKEISLPREGLCGQLPEKQLSLLTSPGKPSVETDVASPGEEIYKASEVSNALYVEKQFPQPISSVIPAVETKMEKDMTGPIEVSCAPSPEKPFMQGSTSGHQPSGDLILRVSDVENGEAMNLEPKFQGPSHDFSWRGRFEIPSATFKFMDMNTWFKAHPRFRVNRNVVNILLRMPERLQFELISRKSVWMELFQDDCPDEDDIGLYFSSGENKRSSDYDFLLVFIDNFDLAMRCDLSGAELFLFTSKVLIVDHQKMNEEYFLWGVFRPIKKHKYMSKLYEELLPVVHQSARNNDDDDDCAVDMEIDMVAGNDVGKIDVAVPRDSSEGLANSSSFKKIKKEPGLDCPPGFEEMYGLKKV